MRSTVLILLFLLGCAPKAPVTQTRNYSERTAERRHARPSDGLFRPDRIFSILEASPRRYEIASAGEVDRRELPELVPTPTGHARPIDPYLIVEHDLEGRVKLETARPPPSIGDVFEQAGRAFAAHDYGAAQELYAQAIEIEPNYFKSYTYIGNVYYFLADLEAAEAAFQRALQLNPNDYQAHLFLGDTYFEMGEFARAKDALLRAFMLNRSNDVVRERLRGRAAARRCRGSERVMIESRVSVLTLANACASADIADHREPSPSDFRPVECFRSVARSVCDAGLTGALEAPYNLDPQTAGRAFLNIYEGLARGLTLGEAASRQRKSAAADPLRRLAGRPVSRMDWPVMRVYEGVRARLLRAAPQEATDELTPAEAGVGRQREAGPLPLSELGFVGQDDALVRLDRIFRTRPAALIRGEAGLGRAPWLPSTPGGRYLLERSTDRSSIARLPSIVAWFPCGSTRHRFRRSRCESMDTTGIAWQAPREKTSRSTFCVRFQSCGSGTASSRSTAWLISASRLGDQDDREELVRFVHRASDSQARFLLTSRNPEPWLNRLAESLELLPLPMRERLLLTQAVSIATTPPPTKSRTGARCWLSRKAIRWRFASWCKKPWRKACARADKSRPSWQASTRRSPPPLKASSTASRRRWLRR